MDQGNDPVGILTINGEYKLKNTSTSFEYDTEYVKQYVVRYAVIYKGILISEGAGRGLDLQ